MIEVNHLHLMWISYSLIVTFSGLNVLFVNNIPLVFKRLFAFGKVHKSINKQHSVIKWLEIPKRWFSHFYIFAALYFLFITKSILCKYFNNSSSSFLLQLLNWFGAPQREGTVKAESVIILSILISLQACRRCYECFCVSIYSDAKMNVLHYVVGFTFYFGVGLSLIHDAPGFENALDDTPMTYISGQWFTLTHFVGISLFLAAFILQFETHKALASLRKKDGKVTSEGHYMPSSGFFEYVSCPHYFAEIVIYMSGCIILGGKSYSWWLMCLWTVTNQTLTGIMNHQWYHKNFKNYPVKRKAVIPFLI